MSMKSKMNIQTMLLLLTFCCMTSYAHGQCDGAEGPCDDASAVDETVNDVASPEVDSSAGPEVTVKKERIKPLWIAGLIAFGVSYATNIFVTAGLAEDEYRSKAVGFASIPLVGQFISIAADSDDYPIPPEYKGPLVLGAMLQIVSAGVFTAGMIIKREPKNKQARHRPRLWITPIPLGRHGAGAVLSVSRF